MVIGKYAMEGGICECIICKKTFMTSSNKRIVCDDRDCRNAYRRCVAHFKKRLAKKSPLDESGKV